ncbi:LAME_0B06282g1_1 [Lachancea meyersii CBS 8951]|uniref:LAME_0B06282g1_1 n=1 Tax=Lachancea meyersii CBS 8951 TaxID=1266667 RepID=A0A1G4IWC4_9SACH|nr:LAME_0B06282g1_1 [Lachancea meyersii CBS 8951]
MSGIRKKKSKQKTLQNLKCALQGLLQAPNRPSSASTVPVQRQTKTPDTNVKQQQPSEEADSPSLPESAGIVYVMSKEAQLIPKLTDEQVLERHKRADENMRRAWSHLIQKYEALQDQGDVVDLTTGEIIEDNGHVRSLSGRDGPGSCSSDPNYVSVLSDLIEIDKTTTNIWKESDNESDNESESESGSESDSDRDTAAKTSQTTEPG